MNRVLYFLAFVAGLAVVCWVGMGYVALSPLALAVTAIIAVVYILGALELYRYQQATHTLDRALEGLSETPASLAQWLSTLDPSLRDAARARVEGERVGLPGPSLTPYLVGLLVLLGMLGTFLGMVATLRGTGLALENATDLQAIRASLAAPITGLGFAFGTSVAGVAASAMLGLLSALCRRDRARAARRLDASAADTLRVYSQAHQREESVRLLQEQAQALPLVVDRLQAMLTAMEQHSQALNDKLVAGQEAFYAKSDARQAALEQQNENLSERFIAGQEAQDAKNEAALAAIEQHTLALSERLAASQEALQSRAETAYSALEQHGQALSERLAAQQEAFHDTTELAYSRLITSAETVHSKLAASTEASYSGLASSLDQSLKNSLTEATRAAGLAIQPVVEATLAGLARENVALQKAIQESVQQQLVALTTTFEQRSTSLVDSIAARLEETSTQLADGWGTAMTQQQSASQKLAADNQQALAGAIASLEKHAASLVRQVGESNDSLRDAMCSQDSQRLAAWAEAFEATTAAVRDEWRKTAETTARMQKEVCDTLAHTAGEIATQTGEHAVRTIAEIERLITAASEAPKIAAEVVAEVRDKLSDSMARDNAMLEERGRLLETLATLLDAVNHASNEQRTAVDALLTSSSSLLDRIGTQVTDKVEAEAGKLGYMASQVSGSAIEIANLGDTFGKAVQSFGESSASLMQHLQRVEETLGKSITRSDEQLAYYVAQAREVVDLSLLSQKQILEQLQQAADANGSKGARPA
ncbi:DUF802 domain-containing protein [Pusillimonas sp.]|uniref:DUF802 domain-containing protein n=1 Tax=Pusillimonas sp. TaxID=3040095 RepID=UPI0037CB0931